MTSEGKYDLVWQYYKLLDGNTYGILYNYYGNIIKNRGTTHFKFYLTRNDLRKNSK